MTLESPIIVFGVGRSGTTLFQKMLSLHPQAAWLSPFCDWLPRRQYVNRWLMRALGVPLLGGWLQRRIKPSECYPFWETHRLGFSRPCRDLTAADVTQLDRDRIPPLLEQFTTRRRNRLLLKITGWPRVGFLGDILPDAKFIHVTRDGRAVAQSLLDISFWKGWEGPEKWRWGALSEQHQQEWDRFDRSFAVLAGIQWKILMDAAQTAMQDMDPSRFLEVRYERLCEFPRETLQEATEFAGLPWTTAYEKKLGKLAIKNTNDKWRRRLNPRQQSDLQESLQGHLEKYGYDLEPS